MTPYFFTNLIIYLFINIFLFSTWAVFVTKRYNFKFLQSIAASFVLGISQIILVEMFLGVVIRRLFPLELFISNILLLLIVIKFSKINLIDFKNFFINSKNAFISFFKNLTWRKPLLLATFIIFLIALINLVILILVQPVSAWDDYGYHMNFVADIINTGLIRHFDSTHSYTTSYPHNIELLNYWHTAFFRNDFLVEITNLTFLIYVSLIIYLVLRKFKVKKDISLISAFITFFIPINILLVKTTKVDLDIAALFFGALYFLICAKVKKDFSKKSFFYILLGCLSVAIIFGSKPSGVTYVGIYVLTGIVYLFSNIKKTSFKFLSKLTLKVAIVLFLLMNLFGTYWYARSWVVFGNPLYPLKVEVLGKELPGEWKDLDFEINTPQLRPHNPLTKLVYVWREMDDWYGIYYVAETKLSGFGSLWYILIFPGLIFGFIATVVRKKYKLTLLLSACGICFWVIPGNWITHYSTIITFAGAVGFGYFISHYFKTKLLYSLLGISFVILSFINVFLVLDGSIFNFKDTYRRIFDKSYVRANSVRFRESNILINQFLDSDDKVYTGDNVYFPYALIKQNFESQVFSIKFTNEDEWLRKLEAENPRLVVVFNDYDEMDVVNKHPELFEFVYKEFDGPTYFYAYTKNPKNQATKSVPIKNKVFSNDINCSIPTLNKYETVKTYGVIRFTAEVCIPEQFNVNNPTLYLHVKDKYNSEVYLDFPLKRTEGNLYEETQLIPPSVGKEFSMEFGLFDPVNYKFYTKNEVNIKE